jgi:hypothetical protein
LMPSRAAMLALPESTLIPAVPPWVPMLLTGGHVRARAGGVS